MLVPETVHKTKYGVVNGKIVPQGTVEVEELVAYNIEDFSDSDLRALIAAGHADYFDPIETQTLKDKGINTNVTLLILKPYRNENYYYHGSTNIPYFTSGDNAPEWLSDDPIDVYDARYCDDMDGCHVQIETNSTGTVTISGDASNYCRLKSLGNKKYRVDFTSSPSYPSSGESITKNLVITVAATAEHDAVSKTLAVTFRYGRGVAEPT